MKKLVFLVLVGLFMGSMTSCAISSFDTDQAPQNALSAYKEVLENKTEFTASSAEDGAKTMYLDQLLDNGSETFKFLNFTVLDLNGDEIPEVVIQYGLANDAPYPDSVEVLYYSQGTVYGYNFNYRGLYALKEDGSFTWSNGAADNGYAKLQFTSENYEYDNLAYAKQNVPAESYFVKDQPVTASEYDDFIAAQDKKKDAIWYDFTTEDINSQLSEESN
ncbi:hypothetical protein Ami103574_09775 [Aminipila butyrica]|uniref:Lipoprotein n=1 Tax=Aminipila butyrica TaxID=433296 RepID=A0A858BY12_9FIRM|nr:hypothetical protein [Aminipila butyrica]QIB69604.1 hypothetical protein Ami103574_09775 [Aminipila butyrica]